MSNVLTTSSTVSCGHPPGAASTVSAAKLAVAGSPVLLATSIMGKGVSSCFTQLASDNTGPIAKPCAAVIEVSAGSSTKLTCGGQPVMLDDRLAGSTDGMVGKVTPQTKLAGQANQSKLSSV
jgi:hypothetical protein